MRALASNRPVRFLLALAVASSSAACALDWASLRADGKTTPPTDAGDAGKDPLDADDGADGNTDDVVDEKAKCSDEALVINEVQTNGPAGAADEFVEIYNPTSCDLPLQGYTIRYSSSTGSAPFTDWTGTASDAIGPGAYVVVGGPSYPGMAIGHFPAGAGALAAAGGGVGIFNAGGKVLDSVAYGTISAGHPLVRPAGGKAAPAPASGQSIARTPDGKNTQTSADDFVVVASPTPAAKN